MTGIGMENVDVQMNMDVLIVGAGASGIGVAAHLTMQCLLFAQSTE